MSHMPVDHPLRGLYRGLALISGGLAAGWGAIAFVSTSSKELFATEPERVLGLTANPFLALLTLAVGALVVVVTLIGRNLDAAVNRLVGAGLLVFATVAICLIRTEHNIFGFSIANVNVFYLVGTLLLTAGMYSTVSRRAPSRRPEHESADEAEREPVGAR